MAAVTDANAVLADYHKWLHRVAYNLDPRGLVDHEDLAQEGYIAMWRALPKHDPALGSLPTWLTNAARLRMTDYLRRGSPFGREATRGVHVAPKSDVPVDDLAFFDTLTRSEEIGEGVLLAYHRGEIAEAIDALTPEQRKYVIARFWGGATAVEIAAAMHKGVPATNWLWHGPKQARAQLRERLSHLVDA